MFNILTAIAVQAHHLGRVGEVTITKDDTLMLNGAGDKEAIQARANDIKSQIEETKSDYEKEKLNVCRNLNEMLST